MNQPTRRRRTAGQGATRTLAIATAMAALIAALSAGQALATPDERVLERQGRIDRQATADQATTQAFEARFDEGFGLAPAHPCPTTELFSFCGTGTITGFGGSTTVTEVVSFENFDPATSCADVVLRRTMTLEDGSTLVLMETGTVCFPGRSALAGYRAHGAFSGTRCAHPAGGRAAGALP